ncbi:MAG: hypothetical protein LUC97_00610, partial [Clostridiales bacterium]|nr:hypothetical protein [Clostridiales bacterium]
MHRYRQRTAENHRKNYYSERGSRPFRKIKDSAFRMLFSDKKNLLLLYKTLHPEDKDVTVDDLETITLETVLAKDIVNDLGFNVRGRLVILVEAQSTFSMNIIPRSLMYLARTYENYFKEKSENLYGTKTVNMPKPELYVIYTGNKNVKDKIVLSEEFFGGEQTDLEVRVNILTEKDGNQNDIINQYIVFSKTIDEQIKLYGRTARAVLEAIRICKGKD